MKFKETIVKTINEKSYQVILSLLIFLILYSIFILFIDNFNLLKVLIFIETFFIGFAIVVLIYSSKIPVKKKTAFFDIFENFLDLLNEGVVIYDTDLRIVFANKAFSKIVNLKKEDLIGLQISQGMIKSETYKMLANLFFPFIKGEDLEIINKKPEIIEVSFSDPEEKYFLISYFEIYLDKFYRLRIVLDKTKDIIESRRKLEFVHLVSHNLLSPLSQIRWSLESINFNELNDSNKEYLNSALTIVKNTLPFVESILSFLRIEGKLKLEIEELNLEKILINILDVLRDKINEKKIKVNLEIQTGEEKIWGDSKLIFAAFFALLENAVIYNKINGLINISIKKQEQRPYRQIIIKDTGIGMTKEDFENLFKKYYRGKKARDLNIQGFGIGLYNAKKIINLHGGEIIVKSEENKGTEITIFLPLDINLIPQS